MDRLIRRKNRATSPWSGGPGSEYWQAWTDLTSALSRSRSRRAVLETLATHLSRFGLNVVIGQLAPLTRRVTLKVVATHPSEGAAGAAPAGTFSPGDEGIALDDFDLYDILLAQNQPCLLDGRATFLHQLFPPNLNDLSKKLSRQRGVVALLRTGDAVSHLLCVTAEDLPEDALPLVAAIAEPVSAALESAAMLEQAETQRNVAETLQRVSSLVNASLDLETVLARILEQLATVVAYDSSAILLEENERLRLVAGRGFREELLEVLKIAVPVQENPLYLEIRRKKAPIYIKDVRFDQRYVRWAGSAPVRSWIGLPLIYKDRIIGQISIDNHRPDAYPPSAINLAFAFAQHVATAIENARLHEQTRQTAVELKALLDSGRDISSTLDKRRVLEMIARRSRELLKADSILIYLLQPGGHTLKAEVAQGKYAERLQGIEMAVGRGVTGTAVATGRGMIVGSLISSPIAIKLPGIPLTDDSLISIPFRVKGEIKGAVTLTRPGDHPFQPADLDLLERLSLQAAIAVENAELYESMERRIEERTVDIRREKERTAAILESAADAIVITDKEGTIEYINPAFTALTGYTPAEAIGHKTNILRSKQTSLEVYKSMWNTILAGKIWRGELQNRRKNGTLYDAELAIAPVMDDKGQLINFIGTQRDVTKSRELERLKDEFLATAAHELRGPMTTVRGYTELLLVRDDISGEEARRFLTYIHEQAVHLANLVSDLLDLARIESGEMFSIAPEPTDVQPLVLGLLEQWRTKAPTHTFILIEPGIWPRLDVDKRRLQQVLENLLSNAVKYSPGGGQVTVEVHQSPANLRFSVIDRGIGMSREEQAHLFEKFWRADATSTAVEGMGLGLAVVKTIVEAHGGRVWVRSQPGAGTTVSFTIPLESRVSTVLIIEDELGVLEVEERILNTGGFKTLAAVQGARGLELAHQEMPDLIVLDLMLPDMSGEEILQRLRQEPATRGIPVVVVSAKSALSHIENTYALGAVDFLTKPFDFEEFLGRIRLALKSRSGERA